MTTWELLHFISFRREKESKCVCVYLSYYSILYLFTVAEFPQFVDIYAIRLTAVFVDSTDVTDHLVRIIPLIKLHGSLEQRVTGNGAKRQLIVHLRF